MDNKYCRYLNYLQNEPLMFKIIKISHIENMGFWSFTYKVSKVTYAQN